MAHQLPNQSPDLIWEIVRKNNAYLAKNGKNGGLQFSRDPLNLTNKHSRKHAGFVNEKAIGVIPRKEGGVTVISKKAGFGHKPAQSQDVVNFGSHKSARKTYRAIANQAAKRGYRADLRNVAVQRVSAIRRAERPVKETPVAKPRGKKAKNAAAAAAAEEN